MTDEEKAKLKAEEKAKAEAKAKEEAELKAKADAEFRLKAEEKLKAERRQKRMQETLDGYFAPVKEFLDEWSEFKTESKWTPKSKRTPVNPTPTNPTPTNPPDKVNPIVKIINDIFAPFSGKGGMWDI